MSEIWKDIPGYEGSYQISNLGRVKSVKRAVNNSHKSKRTIKDRIFMKNIGDNGYVYVILSKNDTRKKKYIHRLIAEAFIPNPENKPEINHKNSIRSDNRIENIEWCTRSENNSHGYKYGYRKPVRPFLGKLGRNHPTSKAVYQYSLNGKILSEFGSISEAGRITGIDRSNIGLACIKKRLKTAGGYVWNYK